MPWRDAGDPRSCRAEDLGTDRTCATTWMLCVLGLEVATWAAVRTPRVPVSITQHHVMLPRVQPAWQNGESDPSVTYFVTRAVAR